MVDKIRALFIFEILGKPPEYIKEALEEFVNKLGDNKGIFIINKKIHEPKPIEEKEPQNKEKKSEKLIKEDLFTTFAEVEVVVDGLNLLFAIVVNMLPSHVEIIEPSELKINNFDLTSLLSELALKLHKFDEVAKTLMLERNGLLGRLREMQGRIQGGVVKEENKDSEQGVTKPQIKKSKKNKRKQKK